MIISAEIRKLIVLARSYAVEYIADHFFFVIGFLVMAGLFNMATDGAFRGTAQLTSLIGYLTWRVAASVIRDLTDSVSVDAEFGILEQIWLTGHGFSQIVFGRFVAIIFFLTLRVLVIALFIIPILGIPLDVSLSAVPLTLLFYLLTFASPLGLALIMIGLQLVYKNVNALTYPLATVLLFLTGALVPLSPTATPWVYTLSRFLPISSGVDLLRAVLVEQASFMALVTRPLFYELLLNSAVYLICGLLVFQWAERKVLQDGTLMHY